MDNDRQVIAAVESSQRRMIAEASLRPGNLITPPPRLPVQQREPVLDADFRDESSITAPPVRPYLTDAQIDAIARRFLSKYPVGDDFEEAWTVYSSALESAVPTKARAEIKERAKALLSINDRSA